MESIKETVEDLVSGLEKTAETKLELWKLKTIMGISETVSSFFSKIILSIIFIATILLISVGVAYKLGRYMGDTGDGFLIVGGFYIVLGIVSVLLQKVLFKMPVQNRLVDKMVK